ncbi:protein-serine/threonine phosphatase [Aspergillus stella-maris]|uniref:protein-serine/threonine phosphatase n=1 Tax=Aspergillus stella-maris TaxID=1810926 RepID=UPI003CCDAA4D
MLLRLPPSLHYPITVTSLLKQPGDEVERDQALFWYVYQTTVTEGDGLGNKVDVKRKFPTRFESTVDGSIVQWKVDKGDVISGPVDFVEIDEPCAHEVQYGGLCAECGKDMTEATYNTEITDSMRAPIQMTHDNTALTVSENEAIRVEEDAKRRLLSNRKLSLVVDLDQTIIHAAVDPTIGDWMQDKDNPNHAAVSDVRAFQLVDDGPGMRGCWYYIKLRPGLETFLQNVAEMYELHIYTMGTRSYAQAIAGIIDPDRKLFGDRILSRDESGSLSVKNLHRLFPVDTKMVVIIDDRGDVWRWTPNLIKVIPYDFFVGIGDINSSFLPKKQEEEAAEVKPETAPTAPTAPIEHANGSTEKSDATEVSTLEQLVTMGGGDNPQLLQEQSDAQDETIMHQVEDRPLLQKQKELDAEDETAESSDSSMDESQDPSKQRHNLLIDNDQELIKLSDRLEQVHRKFYEEYEKKRARGLGGRVAALRGEKAISKEKDVDLKLVPDVKDILPEIKRRLLGNVVIVHSGLWKLNEDTANLEIVLHAKSFGVVFANRVTHKTTHLLTAGKRTAKFQEATRYPNIKIVRKQWLIDSLLQWRHLDETPYLLPIHPNERGPPISPTSKEMAESSWLSSSDEATGDSFLEDDNEDTELNDDILKSSGLDETSPIGYDEDEEAAVHEELKEFLGSDDESESDTEGSFMERDEAPPTSNPTLSPGKKRKRDDEIDDGNDDESSDPDAQSESGDVPGSRLSQRIKRSYQRSTSLKEVASASNGSGKQSQGDTDLDIGAETATGPSPEGELGDLDVSFPETEEEAAASRNPDSSYPQDPAEDDDELEREMLAAFEDGGFDSNVEEDIAED